MHFILHHELQKLHTYSMLKSCCSLSLNAMKSQAYINLKFRLVEWQIWLTAGTVHRYDQWKATRSNLVPAQPLLSQFIKTQNTYAPFHSRQKEIQDAIVCQFIVSGSLPISIVEQSWYKDFLKIMDQSLLCQVGVRDLTEPAQFFVLRICYEVLTGSSFCYLFINRHCNRK
jgi:hypothetical protein